MEFCRVVKEGYCWAVALSFVALIVLGWYMVGLTFYDQWYHGALSLHKSLGMVALLLIVVKGVGAIVKAGADGARSCIYATFFKRRISHVCFYFVMAVITVSGYVISSSAGAAVSVFGLFSVPAIVTVTRGVEEAAIACHFYFAYGTAFLVLLHGLLRLAPHLRRQR